MTKLSAFIVPMLLLGSYALSEHQGMTTQAQVGASAAKKIERVLKVKEPKFKLTPQGTGGKSIRQKWRAGQEVVTVTISEMESTDEAAAALLRAINSVSMGVTTELNGIGDKAYLITASPQIIERKGKSASLVFTRGNVLFSIHANFEHLAKRFAKHMDDDLKLK